MSSAGRLTIKEERWYAILERKKQSKDTREIFSGFFLNKKRRDGNINTKRYTEIRLYKIRRTTYDDYYRLNVTVTRLSSVRLLLEGTPLLLLSSYESFFNIDKGYFATICFRKDVDDSSRLFFFFNRFIFSVEKPFGGKRYRRFRSFNFMVPVNFI